MSETPTLLQTETTTTCNAKCLMCPRDSATRSNHRNRMHEDVFWSTVEQAYEMGVRLVAPFMDGEPLTDSRILAFVEGIAARFHNMEVCWYTNASLLTEDKARRLLVCPAIRTFNVSVQGGDRATYEHVMGLPWERTIENVERLIAVNDELGGRVAIRVHMCVFGPTEASLPAFLARWTEKGVQACPAAFSNFGGLAKDGRGEEPWRTTARKVCDRATNHLYVFWNGDVGQCCFDLLGSRIYGNVGRERLADIWNSEAMKASREAHRKLDVAAMAPICRNCNACRFHG